MSGVRISVRVSKETKERVRRYVRVRGVKAGVLVEQALLHHFQALRELPADIVIPPRLVASDSSFDDVIRLINRPRKPTGVMRALVAGKRGS